MTTPMQKAAMAATATLRHHGVEMHPEDIRGIVTDILATLLPPSPEMIEAGVNTPGMKAVDSILARHSLRNEGIPDGYCVDGKYPLEQAFTAMINAGCE